MQERPELVVASGRGAAYREHWVDDFCIAVDSAGLLSQAVRSRQLSHLSEGVGEPLDRVLRGIRGRMALEPRAEAGYTDALACFDESARRLRMSASNRLDEILAAPEGRVTTAVRDYVDHSERGLVRGSARVSENLQLRKDHREERIDQRVRELWREELRDGLTDEAAGILQAVSSQDARMLLPGAAARTTGDNSPATVGDFVPEPLRVPEHVQQTLAILAQVDDRRLPDPSSMPTGSCRRSP